MKKSLLALAALTAFAGAASAQSSVTLFGIVDASVARLSGAGTSRTGISHSGLSSSRLGFRGVEDVGGGLKAGFWLEGQLTNDDGTAGGLTFQRRSTVSLMGGFGEIRLGRDYSTNFWNTTVYDPFGTNGVGSSNSFGMLGGVNQGAAVRTNNAVSYFLPAMGGLSGQFQYAFGENAKNSATDKLNDYYGMRIGYAAGPVSVHGAYAKTSGATSNEDVKYMNLGVSFAAGPVKPMLILAQEKSGAGAKITAIQPGVVVSIGASAIKASYGRYDLKDSDNDWNKIALGYDYDLSKRTTVYGEYARVSNKGTSARSVSTGGLGGLASAGGSSSGFQFGVRHSF